MDFELSGEHKATVETFHAFAAREIRPAAASLDQEPRFAKELFVKAGSLGFFGMRYPEPEGSGADIFSYLYAVEELAWGSLAVAAACTMQSLMGTTFVHRFAPPSVRERLLLPALRGEVVGTICMTEPNVGSDLLSMTTRAEHKDGRWLITGQKTWITLAPVADMLSVFARTGDGQLSVFLVERGAPGLRIGRPIDKMGVKAALTSEVSFDATPATCILGEPGQGVSNLRQILVDIRLMTAALALGVGRAAFEDALQYSQQRRQFGKPICKFQAIQDHLATMRTELEAARRLMQWAAWRSTTPGQTSKDGAVEEASMAKLYASEVAVKTTDLAARVMASYGYATDYPIERYMRDARFTLIGGGTSEMLKINIARGLTR